MEIFQNVPRKMKLKAWILVLLLKNQHVFFFCPLQHCGKKSLFQNKVITPCSHECLKYHHPCTLLDSSWGNVHDQGLPPSMTKQRKLQVSYLKISETTQPTVLQSQCTLGLRKIYLVFTHNSPLSNMIQQMSTKISKPSPGIFVQLGWQEIGADSQVDFCCFRSLSSRNRK